MGLVDEVKRHADLIDGGGGQRTPPTMWGGWPPSPDVSMSTARPAVSIDGDDIAAVAGSRELRGFAAGREEGLRDGLARGKATAERVRGLYHEAFLAHLAQLVAAHRAAFAPRGTPAKVTKADIREAAQQSLDAVLAAVTTFVVASKHGDFDD